MNLNPEEKISRIRERGKKLALNSAVALGAIGISACGGAETQNEKPEKFCDTAIIGQDFTYGAVAEAIDEIEKSEDSKFPFDYNDRMMLAANIDNEATDILDVGDQVEVCVVKTVQPEAENAYNFTLEGGSEDLINNQD